MIGFGIDPLYVALSLPGMLLGMYAQWRVSRAFSHYSDVGTQRGLSGAETAAAILRASGVSGVRIEGVRGFLADHYDPSSRTLRLSPDVYEGRSIAAAGVAAHEVGHALQHAEGYAFLRMRTALVPVLSVTSTLAMPLVMVGFLLASFGALGLGMLAIKAGAILFTGVVAFQLVTLPVEFDASRRALAVLVDANLLTLDEQRGAREVLSAAALTYVAAAVAAALQLVWFLMRAGLLGRRRED